MKQENYEISLNLIVPKKNNSIKMLKAYFIETGSQSLKRHWGVRRDVWSEDGRGRQVQHWGLGRFDLQTQIMNILQEERQTHDDVVMDVLDEWRVAEVLSLLFPVLVHIAHDQQVVVQSGSK